MQLVLIRGLPGSGKSTKAQELLNIDLFKHFEADMFYDVKGEYKFDIKFIKNAHAWCYNNAIHELFRGNSVIVSNTFTTYNEMEQYLNLKNKFPNIQIKIIEMKTSFQTIHDVPEIVLKRMKERWENIKIPGITTVEILK